MALNLQWQGTDLDQKAIEMLSIVFQWLYYQTNCEGYTMARWKYSLSQGHG